MSSPSASTPAVVAHRSALDSQDRLNAFTQLEQADDLGVRVASIEAAVRNGAVLPLAGIAVGLKDLIDHQGRVTTAGSAFYRNDAAISAPVVQRLEEAGAVIIGRTGLHEFAFGFTSENPHFGPVRNPWDTTCSPGGSSGGSGAAVAAGITPISIGTDTGGSIRVPAALCGCFGLKVTHGRIPLAGVFPLAASLDTVGPLADGMTNLEIAYRVMSGDETHQPAPHRLRLGIPEPWYEDAPLDETVRVSFERALADLDSLGHRVEHFAMPEVMPTKELVHAIAGEVTEVHRDFRARGLPYGDNVARRLDDCAAVTPRQMDEAVAWQQTIRQSFAGSFDQFDLLLTPTTPVTRKKIGQDTIDGVHNRTVLSWFTALVNHSLCPAIAMPLAGPQAPPVSLQAIGPPGSETSILAFGKSLESIGMVRFRPAPGAPV